MEREEIKKHFMQVLLETDWVDMEKAQDEEAKLRDDLWFDSLDQIEICLILEKRFNISIPDKEADNVSTVGDVINLLDRIVNENYSQGSR